MTVSGASNDTVMDNTFADNDAWGTLFVPYPGQRPGPAGRVHRLGWAALTARVLHLRPPG